MVEVTLCDFWGYVLNGHATTTRFYCDTCSGGSQLPCKKSNSSEDHMLKRLHVGALADSSRWAQPSIIPAAMPDMGVKPSWALQTGPSGGCVQLNDLSWCHKEQKITQPNSTQSLDLQNLWDTIKELLLEATKFWGSLLCINSNSFPSIHPCDYLTGMLDHSFLHFHSIQKGDWRHMAGELVCLYSIKHCPA